MLFHQCRLSQGQAHAIAWIEARGAKPGAMVEIPDLGGFWRVDTACPKGVEADWLREKQRLDRKGMPDL